MLENNLQNQQFQFKFFLLKKNIFLLLVVLSLRLRLLAGYNGQKKMTGLIASPLPTPRPHATIKIIFASAERMLQAGPPIEKQGDQPP